MSKSKPELMSQAEFAKHCNVSRMTVSRWRRRGSIVVRDGLVDVAESMWRLAERPERYRGGLARGFYAGGKVSA